MRVLSGLGRSTHLLVLAVGTNCPAFPPQPPPSPAAQFYLQQPFIYETKPVVSSMEMLPRVGTVSVCVLLDQDV